MRCRRSPSGWLILRGVTIFEPHVFAVRSRDLHEYVLESFFFAQIMNSN